MTLLVIVNKKYIRNVTFITVISKAINGLCKYVVLSHKDNRLIYTHDFRG